VTSQWNHVFAFLAKYTWSWAPTQQVIFGSISWETRLKSASSESLSGFLAYLEPKLWHKT